jgi:hypothetical protein
LAAADVSIMTFDNVVPDPRAGRFITLKRDGHRIVALEIPPTFELGPKTSESILEVNGRIEAVQRDTRMTQARRDFLVRRIPYWDQWLQAGAKGIIHSEDYE